MFILHADKTRLTVFQREQVTSGSVRAYDARFQFSPDWEGLTRVAVFRSGNHLVSAALDPDGACQVPWEVTDPDDAGKTLYVGVYGTRDGEVVLPTVWASLGVIMEGVSLGAAGSRPPTPELWRQELDLKQDRLTGLPGQVVGFDEAGNAVARDLPQGGGSGVEIPAGSEEGGYRVGLGLKVENGALCVDCVDSFEGDSTLPMTAAGVRAVVGGIDALLQTI